MMRPDRLPPPQRGFTLVEAIIAIVITGIVAGIVAVFVVRPIQGYLDTVRRAGMSDTADTALRRMAYEIRSAVPNSVRVDPSGRFVEFIPTRDGGRYRSQRDGAGCAVATPADPIYNVDDCSAANNNQFDVLGPPVTGTNGDFVVIFNTGQRGLNPAVDPSLDAYQPAPNNRRMIFFTTPKVRFSGTANPFPPFESPFQRFQIVPASGPVSFGCVAAAAVAGNGGLALHRFTRYRTGTDNWSAQPVALAGTSALLAGDLSSCSFTYQALSAANALLILRLAIQREGETVTLVHEVHVDNTP
jgi:MSHA biogenesis protein MshO